MSLLLPLELSLEVSNLTGGGEMDEGKITLTPQELEDIKDTIKFRTKILIEIKRLCGLPQQVTSLKVWSKVQWFLICVIIATLIGATVNGWAK